MSGQHCQLMKTKTFFELHPVFRFEEFALFMQKQGIHRVASWRQQLSYHHKAGNLIHVRKMLYALKPVSIDEEDFWIDPYLIAGKAASDAILSHHSALELHNLAYTTFEELTFLTSHRIKPFTYQNQRFRAVSFPQSLVIQNQMNNNVESMKRQGIDIKVTTLERTMVDILDRPDLAGGWEEVWRSLDHVILFNPAKLIEYTLLLNNATTVAKVGFFLEQRSILLQIDSSYIEQLLPHIPKQKHYLSRSQRIKGKYIEKWRLIVPLEIIERRWEEPHDDT
jgi:predicted transcriptional regulator of viral defense system